MKEMKKNFRKITSLVIALAVMVTAVVFDVPETVVAEAAVSGIDTGRLRRQSYGYDRMDRYN